MDSILTHDLTSFNDDKHAFIYEIKYYARIYNGLGIIDEKRV